jgi:hypothetical protein
MLTGWLPLYALEVVFQCFFLSPVLKLGGGFVVPLLSEPG